MRVLGVGHNGGVPISGAGRREIATNVEQIGLQQGTNWWGAFVIGLVGTILVTGIAPFAVQSLGAASLPIFVIATAMGVVLCFCLAELATMPDRTGGLPAFAADSFRPLVGDAAAR